MKKTLLSTMMLCLTMTVTAQPAGGFDIMDVKAQDFIIAKGGVTANIIVDGNDWKGVIRAARDLGDDVRKVCGTASAVSLTGSEAPNGSIVVGTIGKSRLIDQLVRKKKIDVRQVRGQWESYLIDVVDGSLVIAGSDKRGTIYGIYEISQRIGVSPWYWWADVPVQHRDVVTYGGGHLLQPSPKVKYRGIFINDEWPSFGTWCSNQFGGINSKAYSRIFELLLRLKANYLWPAMWDSRFNEDDPESPRLADEYGIVMGTSHHEPMMRAHKEYLFRKEEVGPWDYSINKERLDRFFREGMERNKNYENLVTIGMRGDGDVAMGSGNDADNMKTLRQVIDGQRKIIKDIYGRPDGVPQLWAIFTEVQRYYDAGFQVPDDVTLLLCDNNWGYIRRKGRDFERRRKGGLGLYYHIDMNGGPWNDRWVNTTTIPKLREQLHLAYASGIDRIWIINVGDLKPKEVPIDFIMHYAWNPDAIQPGDELTYLEGFTRSVFGDSNAKETADIIAKYSKYNLWRKVEAQVPGLFNTEEMLRTNYLWQQLVVRCDALREQLPAEMQDAFYQLVYYPAVASAGVAQIYNCATIGDSVTINHLMQKDQRLTDYYNKVMADDKWRGMMLDNHIGYTQWFIPEKNFHPMSVYGSEKRGMKSEKSVAETKEYCIPAYNYTRKDDHWQFLPDLGRGKGCMGIDDVMMASQEQGGPALEYEIDTSHLSILNSPLSIAIGILPTQDIMPARGLRLGVQLDDQPMQVLDARRGLVDTFSEYTPENLAVSKVLKPLPPRSRLALSGFVDGQQMMRRNEVFDNLRWLDVTFPVGGDSQSPTGKHTLKIIMIDPEIVVEQIVVNPDNNHYSYFGGLDLTALSTDTQGDGSPASITCHKNGTVTFTYRNDRAKEVLVDVQFAGRHPMTKDPKTGLWTATLGPAAPDMYPYCFIVDGVSVMDPENPQYFPNEGFKNSLLEIPGKQGPLPHDIRNVPHGRIDYIHYYSKSLGATNNAVVYLPPGYQSRTDKSYPVFYLISGTTDTEEVYYKVGRVNYILDNLLAEGKAEEMIVVLPYGNPSKLLAAPSAPTAPQTRFGGDVFSRDLTEDLMPYIEQHYRTINDRDHRAIGGFSRGGNQGLFNGLSHLDKFSYLCSYSSFTSTDIPEVYDRAADTNAKLHLFWLGVGTDDFLYGNARDYMEFLDKKGIRTVKEFTTDKFGHTWMNAKYFLDHTLRLLFNPEAAEAAMQAGQPAPAATGKEQQFTPGVMARLFPKPILSPEFGEGQVTFRLKAAEAREVLLAGEPFAQPLPMQKDADGIWQLTLSEPLPDVFKYCFVVDGTQVADPQNMYLSPNEGFKYSLCERPTAPYILAAMGSEVGHGRVSYDLNRQEAWYYPVKESGAEVTIRLVPGKDDTLESWFKVGGANAIADLLIAQGKARPCILTTSETASADKTLRADDYMTWAERRQALVDLMTSPSL
ncbi:MAG: glycosyl hydrolase 115 family protein [Prevotella sp.]|nr:glycosyl hydrolase 115 family protein [Prevotella sp.]